MKRFTLLELLIVIAIIGILVTMLLPSLRNARKSALSAVCMSNLSQLGTASLRLAVDNDQNIIYSGDPSLKSVANASWHSALGTGKYLARTEEAFTCPSMPYGGNDWSTAYTYSYGAAREGNKPPKFRTGRFLIRSESTNNKLYEYVKMTKVESSSEFFWYADSAKMGSELVQWINFGFSGGVDGTGQKVHTRHNEAANVWFIDGHVATRKIGSLKKLGFNSGWTESGTQMNY